MERLRRPRPAAADRERPPGDARLTVGGERLRTFSVQLDPPPVPDAGLAERLVAASAERYGRDAERVEEDIASALERIAEAREHAIREKARAGKPGAGVAHDAAHTKKNRSRNRAQKSDAKKGQKGTEQETAAPPPPLQAEQTTLWTMTADRAFREAVDGPVPPVEPADAEDGGHEDTPGAAR